MNTNLTESKSLLNEIAGLLKNKHFAEAIPLLREVLAKEPTNAAALSQTGAALLGSLPPAGGESVLDVLLEALYYFNKAGEFSLEDEQITYNRGLCHEKIAREYPTGMREKEDHLFEAMRFYRVLAVRKASQPKPKSPQPPHP